MTHSQLNGILNLMNHKAFNKICVQNQLFFSRLLLQTFCVFEVNKICSKFIKITHRFESFKIIRNRNRKQEFDFVGKNPLKNYRTSKSSSIFIEFFVLLKSKIILSGENNKVELVQFQHHKSSVVIFLIQVRFERTAQVCANQNTF